MIELHPVGFVRSPRREVSDDFWGAVDSEIELAPELPTESLDGLDEYSHVEIIFHFDRIDPADVTTGARRARNNPAWPQVGIFALRTKSRPNRIGATIVRLLGLEGRKLRVADLDAIDGTPVLDIKPVLAEFLPREPVRQPAWTHDLMRDYWRIEQDRPTN
jgi:tRNA-Thr(GGU) m(6)t(6)A37 methyltransferase TsaA